MKCGAEGIGILHGGTFFAPGRELSPEEQYRMYRQVVQAMNGKLVVIGAAGLRPKRLQILDVPESGALTRSSLPAAPENGPEGGRPAVLRMIQRTVREAHRQGVPVALMGELTVDRKATGFLLRTGLDSLSVLPGEVLPLRRRIQSMQYGEEAEREPTGMFGR